MKRIYNYIMLLVVAFSYASCTNDDIDAPSIEAKTGEEVQFGLSLDNGSRTVYGPEKNNAFPIYWVNGDKVKIYSPECSKGRNDAEYSVKPVAGKSYAESLTKTGSYGVQWGDNTTANFYSVYPSLNAVFSGTGNNVTAKLHISNEQKSNQSGVVSADMDNVIMYAQTNGAEAGKTVNLKYIPYSTVFEFTANLGRKSENSGYGKVKIVSLTLTAPTGTAIAGDFNLKFNGNGAPDITAAGNNSNVITLVPETQPLLNEANKTAKINLAMIPLSGVNDLDGWTVTINVLEGNETTTKAYTKKLNGNYALAPGKIHRISLPKITPAVAWTYNLSNWIPSLYQYQQIYLTELSLPGAWYASAKVSDGYQSTQSIADLWNAGVRAFAVETKCVSKTFKLGLTYPLATPSDVVVSGTADNASLSTASGSNTLKTGSGDKVYKEDSGNITLKTVFENIISCLKTQKENTENKPEFAVLVLSYADGGTTGMRPVDFGAWLELLYDSYNSLSAEDKKYIYTEEVNADTTVGDVLNKLIIKVNVDANIAQGGHVLYDLKVYKDERTYLYANNLPALFSYNPFMSQFGSSDYYSTPLFSKNSWMNWSDATNPYRSYSTTVSDDFLWCFSSANRTKVNSGTNTTIPSYAERQEGLRTMITRSREISSKGTHNVWFYFNAGGTQTTSKSDESTSATDFAKTMNPWLLDVITLKSNGGVDTNGSYTGTSGTIVESDPSPLGIVMFNQCTGANDTYKGADIIKAIIDMNDKFTLKRAPVQTMADYDGAVNNGGNAITTK